MNMAQSAKSISSFRKKVAHTHGYITASYHEAGHIIYAFLHYMTVHAAQVYQDKKTKRIDGWTHYDCLNLDTIEDSAILAERLQAEVGLSYAGLVAEKLQFKQHSGSDKLPSFLGDASLQDLSEASKMIKKYQIVPAGSKRYNYKKRMVRQVLRELEEHWDAVTLIAHALYQKKRLNFAELKNLLTKKTENKKFWKERLKIIENFYQNDELDEKKFKVILPQ